MPLLRSGMLRDFQSLLHPGMLGVLTLASLGPKAGVARADDPAVNYPVTTALTNQNFSTASTPVADGMIVVWTDFRNGTDGDVYAQHMTACGPADPAWPVDGLVVATGSVEQRRPVVTADGLGGAYVTWINGLSTNQDIYTQHVLSTGVVDPGWPANGVAVCNVAGAQSLAKSTTDGSNGAFVTWQDVRLRVFVQHLLLSGVDPSWTVNGIRACPGVEATQNAPEICTDAAGGAIIAWNDRRPGTVSDIYAQRMTASGALLWSPSGEPVCTAAANQILNGAAPIGSVFIQTYTDVQACALVPDGAGGCLVTYVDDRDFLTNGHDVYGQRLTASGSVAPGWDPDGVALCTAPDNQMGPITLADGAGGLFATWLDTRPEVYVQHATGAGVVDGPVDGLVLTAYSADGVATGVADGAGGAIFAWSGFTDSTFTEDVFALRLGTSLAPDPSWPSGGAIVSSAPEDQFRPVPVSDGSGGAILHWMDGRDFFATTGVDIYSQRVLGSGALPTGGGGALTVAITGPPSGAIYAVNTPVTFTGTFTDAGAGTHSAEWTFDGLAPVPGTVDEDLGTVTAEFTFTTPGVYTVSLTVTGGCGSATATTVGEFEAMVVIYDPDGGFVTGGGWINSPAGAYVEDPTLTGKANFGFVSKYKKNATVPTGDTEFQFKTAGLDFHSSLYEWLVVAGSKAQYKGTGTINDSGTYKFMLTATDGALQGGNPDKFRMRITDTGGAVIYDNQLSAPDGDDPTTALGGGSIVIHKTGGQGAGIEVAMGPQRNELAPGLVNPLRSGSSVGYSLAERSRVSLKLYDVGGRLLSSLVNAEQEAGTYSAALAVPGDLPAGVYFLRMVADSMDGPARFQQTRSLVVVH